MKRVIVALLMLLSAAAAATVYVNTDNAQRQLMQHAAASVGQPFTIPGDPRLADPVKMYAALRTAAADARVNVFRTSVGYTADGRPQVTQYVLLTTNTHLFNAFSLRAGRWLGPEDADHPERFLSTTQTGSPDQVGVLGVFGGNDLVAVRGLHSAFDSLQVAGTYDVESSAPSSFDRFLNSLAQASSQLSGGPGLFTAASFMGGTDSFAGYATDFAPILNAVQYVIIFFTALFLAFQVLHDAKKAGVMKLHGFGVVRVWFAIAGRLILISLVTSEAIALLATRFVPDTTFEFTVSVGLTILRAFAVMLVASIVACAYVARTNISNSIKNRKDTRGVFAVNTLVKIACSVALIAVGAGLWLQYTNAAAERQQFGNWDRARGFGIFSPQVVGNDLVETETGGNATTAAEVYDLYPALNDRGALYVDARNYEPLVLAEALPPGAYRTIDVNVNYLKQFPLRDDSGRTIVIGENTTDWVVLAPSRYRSQQAEILAYFQLLRTGNGSAEQAAFGRPAPPSVAHQKVSIIWTQDNQAVFSFNPLVNPDHGNNIVDPFIEVITSANSLGLDRANMLSGGGGTAMKIRLLGGDTVRTMQDLLPTLKRLKLDDNLPYLVTMDEYVSQQIAALDTGIRITAIAGIALLVGLLVLAVQSLSILFERYSRRITVRRLFGAGFMRTYREPLLIFTAVWTFQLVGALVANRLGLNPFSTPTFSSVTGDGIVVGIAACVAALEVLFSAGVLTFIERRSVIRVLKQEF
ncbi:MAG: bacteriocin-associated integral membrane family protein [Candidatus Dormibacteraceae bacterium]